jgi:hypothetical protein
MHTDDYFGGWASQPIERNDIFIDREQYIHAFKERLKDHSGKRYPPAELLDFHRPARNVIVFYGEGGIGKSTILHEIARIYAAFQDSGVPRNRALIKLDMADYSNHNFENILLRLRAGLGQVSNRWPAFDRGLAQFWTRKYPGVPLAQFIAKSSFLDAQERRDLAAQLTSVADSLLGGMGLISTAYWLTSTFAKRAASARVTSNLRRDFEPFRILMEEADPEKQLGYLPILLARDLEQHCQKRGAAALCVLDTFEQVQGLRRGIGSLEDLIHRLVYLMPNVFFTIAGRGEVGWYREGQSIYLTYGAGSRWDFLAPTARPWAQYPLERLSTSDADAYLRARLTIGGESAIDEAIRDRIAAGSDGWPLYLDLSADLFRELRLSGKAVSANDFGKSFPQLVVAIMRDLSVEERDLLRAASLFTSFDAGMLSAAVPNVRGSTVQRFLSRSFVQANPGRWPPYFIHSTLRRSVLQDDEYTDEAWTDEERSARILTVLSYIEDAGLAIWQSSRETSERGELANLAQKSVSAFLLAVEAALETGVLPPRLGTLAFTVSEMGYWRVIATLERPASGPDDLRRLIDTSRISTDVQRDPATRYRELMSEVTLEGHHKYDEYVIFQAATLAQLAGEDRDAESLYSSLGDADPIIRDAASWGLAGMAFRRSDLADALARVRAVRADRPLDYVRNRDLLGHIYLHGGEFERAANLYGESLTDARRAEAPLWIARGVRHLLLANMWFAPRETLKLVPEAYELNMALGDQIGMAQCEMARGLALAMLGMWRESDDSIKAACERTDDYGAVGHPLAVKALIDVARGRTHEAEVNGNAVFEHASRGAGVNPPLWRAVTALWIDRQDLFQFGLINWYDSVDAARQRWLTPVSRLRVAAGQVPS